MRKNISSASPWEEKVGYSRAVRVGNMIEVAGTTAMDGDRLIGKDDLYVQTFFVLQKIKDTLEQAGASMDDVVRTRMYVTDISKWEEAAKAHAEFFQQIKPASTMVQVTALIDNGLLIEIEASAILENSNV